MITMKRKFIDQTDGKDVVDSSPTDGKEITPTPTPAPAASVSTDTVVVGNNDSKKVWIPGKVERVNGSILNSTANYIVHQCNCVTPHSKGLAEVLFEKFPWANDYLARLPTNGGKRDVAGTISVRGDGKKERFVINLFAQFYPGKPSTYESEEKRRRWFKDCLTAVSKLLASSSSSSISSTATAAPITIAFPDGIGCTMAKGSWPKYLAMIETFAAENPHLHVSLLDYTKK